MEFRNDRLRLCGNNGGLCNNCGRFCGNRLKLGSNSRWLCKRGLSGWRIYCFWGRA
jgi:hypothetical protein